MRLPTEPDPGPQVNIVPMIDVIFAILVYFIVASLFLTRSEGLPVNLPKATTSEAQNSPPITVSLDAQGNLTVNRQPSASADLRATVERLVQPGRPAVVVINADEGTNYGQVVTLMDQLRQIPGVRLAIATRRP
ncbi:MAG: biopolymer transporter ExbD [Gloeomargaritaceae cyanobacterium C42_A2020_066]|nr:biopolymer transporter ExbD [Gloeomargaritaceae cyanobacterium C42_A2020_066]